MFGKAAIKQCRQFALIIPRVRGDTDPALVLDRLTGARASRDILDTSIPGISLPIAIEHRLSVLVDAAAPDSPPRLQDQYSDEPFAARQA